MKRGKFLSFEGIDGAGKSSHIAGCAAFLRGRGMTVVETREPGGTALGEKLRALLLSESMSLETETLLMFAARREHVVQVIEPALKRGAWVLSDRFTDATRAYQGGGRGLDSAVIEALAGIVHPGLTPDLTLLFDLDPAVAQGRISQSRDSRDRFEAEAAAFHTRVRDAYLKLAKTEENRFFVINSSNEINVIESQIKTKLSKIIENT